MKGAEMAREMSRYGTQFLESEAILAAQEGDKDHLRTILSQMLPGELKALEDAAGDLEDMAHEFRLGGRFGAISETG